MNYLKPFFIRGKKQLLTAGLSFGILLGLSSFGPSSDSEWLKLNEVEGVTFYVKLEECASGKAYFVKAENSNAYEVNVDYTFTQPVLPVRGPKEGQTSIKANDTAEGTCDNELQYEAIVPDNNELNISISATITKN